MYDDMAKSAKAGEAKASFLFASTCHQSARYFPTAQLMNVGIYKTGVADQQLVMAAGGQRDLVEETIRDRVRAADEEKKRILGMTCHS